HKTHRAMRRGNMANIYGPLLGWLVWLLFAGSMASAQGRRNVHQQVPLDAIRLSDPFILADAATKTYYMTGTGGRLWKSNDLRRWEGPYTVALPDTSSWMGNHPMIWAAEIHPYKGKYYYFATFTNR